MQMPPTIGDAFQPGSDIDPVAKNVTAVGNDVADIDANAEFQALVRRYLRISSDDAALNFDRTSDRVNDARKLGVGPFFGRHLCIDRLHNIHVC